MKLEADTRVAFPRDRVWKAYLDELEKLTEFLPNVRQIERRKQTEEGGLIKIERLWTAKGNIPGPAQAFLKPHMLQWTDFATWDAAAWCCEWRIETGAFPGAVDSKGVTRYEAVDERTTLVSIRGDIDAHPEKVPGVPRFLAGTVRPIVEKVIVAAIAPNLRSVAQGVEKYLQSRAASAP